MLLAKGPTPAEVTLTMIEDQHPPLYFILIRAWMDAVGNSEIMTRLLSTFWSLLTIAAVYRLTADQFGSGTGVLAALILALTDNDIMLAREVRHYTQLAAFAALSSLYFLRYARRPARGSGIAWFATSVALLYTHYLGAFVLLVQGVYALLCLRPFRRLPDVFFRLALIGSAWLPWAFVFINQALVRYTRPRIFQSTYAQTPDTLAMVRGDLVGSHFGITIGLMLLGLLTIFYLKDGVRITLHGIRRKLYLALWVILPTILIFLIDRRFPILTTQNFLVVTPPIAVMIAVGFMNLERTARLFLLVVFVTTSLFTVDAYRLKPPWREVATDVLTLREDDESILMDVWVDDMALRYHIGRALNADPAALPLVSMWEWREQYGADYFAYLLAYLQDKPAFWLAYKGQNLDKLLDFFPQHGYSRVFTKTEYIRDDPIYVYRYERNSGETVAAFGEMFLLQRVGISHLPTGETRVNLLWGTQKPPALDYSISVFILDAAGALVDQDDAPPLSGSTSAWTPGGLYFDSHTLRKTLPAGTYAVGVKVYFYADPAPLSVNGGEYITVGTVTIP